MRDKARHGTEKVQRTFRQQRWLIVALLVVTAFIATPSFASADSSTGTPTLWTDQPSYAPGDVASISGSGFVAGDSVSVSLSDSISGWTSGPVAETIASDGTFTGTPLTLPSAFSSSITATATDSATGDTASAPVMETMAGPSFTPAVTTDQLDYPPGSIVTITGTGWPSDDNVTVFTNDTLGNTWSKTDQVTTDGSGGFTDKVTLPNTFISNYTVTASDASGLSATTSFTDANNNPTLEAQSSPPCTTGQHCDKTIDGNWNDDAVSGWAEGNQIPVRVWIPTNGTSQAYVIPFDRTQPGSNSTTFGLEPVLPLSSDFTLGAGVTYSTGGQPTLCDQSGPVWAICFKVDVAGASTSSPTYVKFHLKMSVGARLFNGNSMAIGGTGDSPANMGNVQVNKPGLCDPVRPDAARE
jgi:hypothetical protein